MKSFTVIAVAGLVALVSATPVEKRATVVHTVIEEVIETVDVTTTIYVKATDGAQEVNQLSAEPTAVNHRHHLNHNSKSKSTTKEVTKETTKATTNSSPPSVAPEPVPTTPTTTPTTASPSPTSSPTSASVPAYSPPVVEYTPPVVVPETTKAPVSTPEPTSQPPAPSSTPSTTPSTGGACGTVGGECEGEITFYEAGLGACGWTNDGNSEDVFALAHGMMGTQSNGNPFCGRMATIELDGKTVTAKLVDKCMGCVGEDIDLSTHLFDQLAHADKGRIPGVKWHFNS